MQSVYCKCHVGCRVLHVYQVLFGFYPFHAVFHKHFDSFKHSSKIWSIFFYNLLGSISIMAEQKIFQLCNILLYPIVIGGYWPSDIAIYCFFIYMSTGFELIFSPSILFFVHLFEINNRHWPFYWFNEGDKYTISFSNLLARKN